MARTLLGLLCGALVAALGAVIAGEYEFDGLLPFVAGPLFGLAVAEAVVAAGRSRSAATAGVTALLALAGVTWAGWIDAGRGVEPMKPLVWVAAALAALVAYFRTAGLRHPRP